MSASLDVSLACMRAAKSGADGAQVFSGSLKVLSGANRLFSVAHKGQLD